MRRAGYYGKLGPWDVILTSMIGPAQRYCKLIGTHLSPDDKRSQSAVPIPTPVRPHGRKIDSSLKCDGCFSSSCIPSAITSAGAFRRSPRLVQLPHIHSLAPAGNRENGSARPNGSKRSLLGCSRRTSVQGRTCRIFVFQESERRPGGPRLALGPSSEGTIPPGSNLPCLLTLTLFLTVSARKEQR